MRSLKKIVKDDRGANAIEYAVIGALIGIGLISTLVGTRTSLSAIFGTAANQMASGGSGGAAQSNPAFAGKTVQSRAVSQTVYGANKYDYVYADGSKATYIAASIYNGNYYRPNVTMIDAASATQYSYAPGGTDPVTGQALTPGLSTTAYYADGNRKTYTSYNPDATGQVLTGYVQNFADQSGAQPVSGANTTVSNSQFQSIYDQYNAYAANP